MILPYVHCKGLTQNVPKVDMGQFRMYALNTLFIYVVSRVGLKGPKQSFSSANVIKYN